jgi:hypothetical protein
MGIRITSNRCGVVCSRFKVQWLNIYHCGLPETVAPIRNNQDRRLMGLIYTAFSCLCFLGGRHRQRKRCSQPCWLTLAEDPVVHVVPPPTLKLMATTSAVQPLGTYIPCQTRRCLKRPTRHSLQPTHNHQQPPSVSSSSSAPVGSYVAAAISPPPEPPLLIKKPSAAQDASDPSVNQRPLNIYHCGSA